MSAVSVSSFDTGPVYYLPGPPPGAIRGPYPPRFAPYPVNQGPPILSPEKLDLRDRVLKQVEYYFRQVMLLYINFFVIIIMFSLSFIVALEISYYLPFIYSLFSDENLENDHYLISLMDEEGWVPTKIIAGFKRVKLVT